MNEIVAYLLKSYQPVVDEMDLMQVTELSGIFLVFFIRLIGMKSRLQNCPEFLVFLLLWKVTKQLGFLYFCIYRII